jgi:hypothetical protein
MLRSVMANHVASELSEPRHWTQDANHQAAAIRCAVCLTCVWYPPKNVGRCMFGGPYVGYELRQMTDLGEQRTYI